MDRGSTVKPLDPAVFQLRMTRTDAKREDEHGAVNALALTSLPNFQ